MLPALGVPGKASALSPGWGGQGHFWMWCSILSCIAGVCQEEGACLPDGAPGTPWALCAVACLLPSHAALPASRGGGGGVDMADKGIISPCCCFICCAYHMRLPVQEAPAVCFLWLCDLFSTTGHLSLKFGPCSLSTVKEMWRSSVPVLLVCTCATAPAPVPGYKCGEGRLLVDSPSPRPFPTCPSHWHSPGSMGSGGPSGCWVAPNPGVLGCRLPKHSFFIRVKYLV